MDLAEARYRGTIPTWKKRLHVAHMQLGNGSEVIKDKVEAAEVVGGPEIALVTESTDVAMLSAVTLFAKSAVCVAFGAAASVG